MDGQENLERTWKVREKSGTLKINSNSWQSSENLFILFKMGKDVLPQEIVKAHLPPHWGYSYWKQFASLGSKFFPLRAAPAREQILSYESSPQIRSDTVSTIKVVKKVYLSEGMENCKMSGKNQGKVREL